MDPKQNPKLKNCSKHNQPVIVNDHDPRKQAYCLLCIQETPDMPVSDSCLQQLNAIIKQADEQFTQNNKLLLHWHNNILSYKGRLIYSLDMILKFIMDQVKVFGAFKQKLKKLSQAGHEKTADELQQECQDQQQRCEQVKNQLREQLEDFNSKHSNNVDELLPLSNQKQKTNEVDQIKFQYELIKESCMQEKNKCGVFAFNKISSMLAVAQRNEIIIYEFNKGVINKELQRLANHSNVATCLHFMNQSNTFVSGSQNQSIIIWEYDLKNNQYCAKQMLKDHTNFINCILISKNDDFMISGSEDKTIKIWNQIDNSWVCIQTISLNHKVWAISLNDLEDKLISSGDQNVIQCMKKGNDNKWSIVQTINVCYYGTKLCFTIENQFIFLPDSGEQLQIYKYNQQIGKFEILNAIKMNSQFQILPLFPCQYIKKINVLSVRNGSIFNIFKVKQDGYYQLIQQIQFMENYFFGRLTDDGQYLVTWDKKSVEIQIRELKYQL